jgi:C4-dicarboxylate-specific signal transduction histidine kinase
MLKENELEKEMDHIVQSAEYLSNTIEIFRNFLKQNKEFKAVSIQNSIEESLHILQSTIEKDDIKLINNTKNIDNITIGMIEGELEQVIINIINNARDIFVERDISNRTLIVDLIKKEDKVVVTIEDNAGGIAQDVISKVFEAYFTTKHQSQGTGLGLYMSYRIVTESLNGDIYVKNTDDGAKFFIEIPLNS